MLALVGPFSLQLVGLVPASYVFSDGRLQIMPLVVGFREGPTLLFLSFVAVTPVLLTSLVVLRRQGLVDRLEERLFVQAWTLGRMVPREVGVSLQHDSQRPP